MGLRFFAGDHDWEATSFVFPGGEVQLRAETLPTRPIAGDVAVLARVQSCRDLVESVLGAELLGRYHEAGSGRRTLVMPYFPYARQDRVMVPFEAFSLKAVAGVVNRLGFDRVVTCDPHSDVTAALVDGIRPVSQVEIVRMHGELREWIGSGSTSPTVVAPDAGAAKKAFEVARNFGLPLAIAGKVRDVRTGEITGTYLHDDGEFVSGHDVLIVDDICDGGRTFVELARVLKGHGAAKVALYVTHGIFSRGLSVFEGLIDAVFSTDAFLSPAVDVPRWAGGVVPIYVSRVAEKLAREQV